MTFHDIDLTAAMKIRHRFPASMRSVVVAIHCAVNGASFPVETVPPLELEREPHIHKTAIYEEHAQCIELRDHDRGDHVGELGFSDVSQQLDIYRLT